MSAASSCRLIVAVKECQAILVGCLLLSCGGEAGMHAMWHADHHVHTKISHPSHEDLHMTDALETRKTGFKVLQ